MLIERARAIRLCEIYERAMLRFAEGNPLTQAIAVDLFRWGLSNLKVARTCW